MKANPDNWFNPAERTDLSELIVSPLFQKALAFHQACRPAIVGESAIVETAALSAAIAHGWELGGTEHWTALVTEADPRTQTPDFMDPTKDLPH